MKISRMSKLLLACVALAMTIQFTGCCGTAGGGTVGAVVPTITKLEPPSAAVGAAAQTLTIVGTNYLSTSTVTYNSVAHAATFVSSTELTINLSAADQATAGSFPVQVTNPGGITSNVVDFTVTAAPNPVPVIINLTPPSALAGAAAQTLVITGKNFIPGSSVTYNGVVHPVSATPTYVSSTELTITLSATDQATVGSFPVQVTNPAPGGGASNIVDFQVTSPAIGDACITSNALVTLINGSNVTAYVPNGAWDNSLTGIEVVPLEPTPVTAPSLIATPNTPNACAGNDTTQEVVCTGNNTDVYVITGTTASCLSGKGCAVLTSSSDARLHDDEAAPSLATLTSGSNGQAGFSGGECNNCGIAINAVTNTAVIQMGLSTSPSSSGFQFLDLATNTFGTPIPTTNEVSENIQWDPNRNVSGTGNGIILSPNEAGNYDVLQVTSTNGLIEFANPSTAVPMPEYDSASEDCTTGIAMSTDEFTSSLYIADLTQGTFTTGTPGTWTAPNQIATFPEFSSFGAGTNGIAVVPGFHLAIVTGEFGASSFAAVNLPTSSGSGTPTFGDYAQAVMPNTPDGNAFVQGDDPHTIYAYKSPNNGKAYGLLTSGEGEPPTYVGVIDLALLLAAPRTAGTHTVDPTYDLLTNGVVRYVCANATSCAAAGTKLIKPRRESPAQNHNH